MALPLAAFFTGGLFAKILGLVIASAAVRVIAAIGLTVVSFTGINLLFTEIDNFVMAELGGLSSYITDFLQLFGFTFTIEIILATMASILAIKSLTSLKRLVVK